MYAYTDIFSRNIGFFSESEQLTLRNASVFVFGVGGMGGACVQTLVRAGIENIGLADFDHFELSNFNRQVFSNINALNKNKCDETKMRLLEINPGLVVESYSQDWVDNIDYILKKYDFVVNCMDDIKMTLFLYRKCQEHKVTVVDCYSMSPLPSVFVINPGDPVPEKRLGFPSVNKDINELSKEDIDQCKLKELEYIMTISSSVNYVKMEVAEQVISGHKPRFSLAPMVFISGNLMAYETIFCIFGKKHGTDFKGYFFNPYLCKIEKENGYFKYLLKRFFVKRFLGKYKD